MRTSKPTLRAEVPSRKIEGTYAGRVIPTKPIYGTSPQHWPDVTEKLALRKISMAFAIHATINGLVLVFVSFAAYGEDTTFSIVSEDGGKTLKVVRVEESVLFSPIHYATAQLTGDIQQTG